MKCPKCATRKAKRPCPALGAEICAPCCAENRLKTIPCPQDCPYLEAEYYQLARRRSRAASRGRKFVDWGTKLFAREEAREFAFNLQADLYFFIRREHGGRITNVAAARALDHLKGLFAAIFVPDGGAPHPLTSFLKERLEDAKRYPRRPDWGPTEWTRTIGALVAHVRSLGGEETTAYWDEVANFFDALDFEADLDYSPLDGKTEAPPASGFRESASGLIIPT
jgi:hypothetical protein